jgi:hypothetical protein
MREMMLEHLGLNMIWEGKLGKDPFRMGKLLRGSLNLSNGGRKIFTDVNQPTSA